MGILGITWSDIEEYILVALAVTSTLMGTVFLGSWIQNYPENPSNFTLWYGSFLLALAIILAYVLFSEFRE